MALAPVTEYSSPTTFKLLYSAIVSVPATAFLELWKPVSPAIRGLQLIHMLRFGLLINSLGESFRIVLAEDQGKQTRRQPRAYRVEDKTQGEDWELSG